MVYRRPHFFQKVKFGFATSDQILASSKMVLGVISCAQSS